MYIEQGYGQGDLDSDQQDILDEFYAIDIPNNPRERYEVFKNYIGQWHYYDCMYDYLQYALREDDVHAIKNEILKLDKIRKHALLLNENTRHDLYESALRYMARYSNNPELKPNFDDETLTLMICVLHENGYFDVFYMPDEAFVIDNFANRIEMLGRVYGKYFRFYNYLHEKLLELQLNKPQQPPQKKRAGSKPSNEKSTIRTFRDVFYDTHKEKHDKMIVLLARELPSYISRDYPELRRLDGPFISKSGNNYELNSMLPFCPRYLAGIFFVCKAKSWLRGYSMKIYREAIERTFNTEIGSPTAMKDALYGDLADKYIKPFTLLFKDIS